MPIDQEEKDRLAQLGLDRRLAEAVGGLDTEAATFVRIAGDENAEEAEIMQAASNFRAAVQRRNIAFDKACGVPDDQAGKPGAPSATLDEEALRKAVEAVTPKLDKSAIEGLIAEAVAAEVGKIEPPKATIDETALSAAVDAALKTRLPQLVSEAVDKKIAEAQAAAAKQGTGAKSS